MITPAEPPQKKTNDGNKTASGSQSKVDDGSRNQYILSFSPKQWKVIFLKNNKIFKCYL